MFIITEKVIGKERKDIHVCRCYEGQRDVGVMKDKEMKFEDVKVPHTSGLRITHTTSEVCRHRFHRRSRKTL